MSVMNAETGINPEAFSTLWGLTCQVRAASDAKEIAFLLVNETRALLHYRQAAFFLEGQGVHTLSGVVQIESNAPYVQWLNSVFEHVVAQSDSLLKLSAFVMFLRVLLHNGLTGGQHTPFFARWTTDLLSFLYAMKAGKNRKSLY